ncbi:hypothetical protein ABIB50_002786 [Mucilaginibacter sp. UYCu711]
MGRCAKHMELTEPATLIADLAKFVPKLTEMAPVIF